MALKRLPSDLTFDKIRNQQSPLSAPTQKSSSRTPPETLTNTDPDTVADKEKGGRGAIIKEPDPKGENPPGNSKEQMNPAKAVDVPICPSTTVPASSAARAKTTIKGQVSLPADGASPTFDEVKARYGDKVAFKHILGLALRSYADAIHAGDFRAIAMRQQYESHPTAPRVSPTRSVSTRFFEAATTIHDPLGIMGPSALGSVVMKTALSWYIDHDRSGT